MIDMMREMIAQGHSIGLCVINKDYDYDLLAQVPDEVNRILLDRPVGLSGRASMPYMRKLSKAISEYGYEILHCQGINCVLFAGLAKLHHPSLRVLNTVHDAGNYPSYSNKKIFLQNRICCMNIAISHCVEREILSRRMNPAKVTTLYNAINTTKFQVSAPAPGADPTTGETAPEGLVRIGNVARFHPAKKGQDTLVEALTIMMVEDPSLPAKLHCSFAGEIFKGQDQAYRDLQKYIGNHYLASAFSFEGNVKDIPAFLHSLDFFVFPSRYEGFGISLIEAMSCGLPCVASNLEGPQEIFELAKADGVNVGLLFEAGNVQDLVRALREMLSSYKTYDPAAISAFVKRHFSIEEMVKAHIELYKS